MAKVTPTVKAHVNLSGWKKMFQRVREAAGADARVKIGVFGGNHPGNGIGMVELATIHEFGSPARNIPERSFIRKTFDIREHETHTMVVKVSKAYVKGTVELGQALGLLGQWFASQVKKTITQELVTPKLSESAAGRRTIAHKGSHVTLVDTGALLQAITWQVVGISAPAVDQQEGDSESGGE